MYNCNAFFSIIFDFCAIELSLYSRLMPATLNIRYGLLFISEICTVCKNMCLSKNWTAWHFLHAVFSKEGFGVLKEKK